MYIIFALVGGRDGWTSGTFSKIFIFFYMRPKYYMKYTIPQLKKIPNYKKRIAHNI